MAKLIIQPGHVHIVFEIAGQEVTATSMIKQMTELAGKHGGFVFSAEDIAGKLFEFAVKKKNSIAAERVFDFPTEQQALSFVQAAQNAIDALDKPLPPITPVVSAKISGPNATPECSCK